MGNFLKSLSSVAIIVLLVFLCFAFAMSTNKTEDSPEKTTPLSNPATIFCTENEGEHLTITENDGSQFGVCNFDDGSSCKDLAFLNGKCKKGDLGGNNLESNDFEVTELLNESCEKSSECKIPEKYSSLSDCLYEARCLQQKCIVVCPTSKVPEHVSCTEDSYDLECVCLEGEKDQIKCPEGTTCPAVVQFECVK